MKKCAIFYSSVHHKNTERLVKEIAGSIEGVEIFSLLSPVNSGLKEYDFVGFASGVYMGKPHRSMTEFIKVHGKELSGKKAFTILTCGSPAEKYSAGFESLLSEYEIIVKGAFRCKGFDTFGPFKLIGGIAKGHPDKTDVANAVTFVKGLI